MGRLKLLAFSLFFVFLFCGTGHAQGTIIDGSQTNLVILKSGQSGLNYTIWKSKYIPSHIIFSFEPVGGGVNIIGNASLRCTLDDASLTPTDNSTWFDVAMTVASIDAVDASGPQIGSGGGTTSPQIVQSGVMPCTAWAIKINGFNGGGGVKLTAVQLPASGDAAWLYNNSATGSGAMQGGAVRINTQTPCSGGGCPAANSALQANPLPVQAPANNTTPLPVNVAASSIGFGDTAVILSDNAGMATVTALAGFPCLGGGCFYTNNGVGRGRFDVVVNFFSITGTPATCTIQPQVSNDQVNWGNDGTALAFGPPTSNGVFVVHGNMAGKYERFLYSCGTFPTGGSGNFTVMTYPGS